MMGPLFINNDVNRPALMYGDPAYGEGVRLRRKHKGVFRSQQQVRTDVSMSRIREMVEHSFGKVVALWAFMDYHKKHMLWRTPTVDEWICAVFLTNIHTCSYGSQMNSFIQVYPPSVAEYLRNCHAGLLI